MKKDYKEVSKYLMGNTKLDLNRGKSVSVDDLVWEAKTRFPWFELGDISRLIEENPHQYKLSPDKKYIHAIHGRYQMEEPITAEPVDPPMYLYFGTDLSIWNKILKNGGIVTGTNGVYLSETISAASEIAKKRGNSPVVFAVAAHYMWENGAKFIKTKNDRWVTNQVEARFMVRANEGGSNPWEQ